MFVSWVLTYFYVILVRKYNITYVTLCGYYLVVDVCVLTYFYVILVIKYDITYVTLCNTLPQQVLGAMHGVLGTR